METAAIETLADHHRAEEERLQVIDEFLAQLGVCELNHQETEHPLNRQTVSIQMEITKIWRGLGQARMCRRACSIFFYNGERIVRYQIQTSNIPEIPGTYPSEEAIQRQVAMYRELLSTLEQFIWTQRLDIRILIEPAFYIEANPTQNYRGAYLGKFEDGEWRLFGSRKWDAYVEAH